MSCVSDDLADSTPRQIQLQRLLGLSTPALPARTSGRRPHGEKLSKQNGATALSATQPLAELDRAATHLGIGPIHAADLAQFWEEATRRWSASRWMG